MLLTANCKGSPSVGLTTKTLRVMTSRNAGGHRSAEKTFFLAMKLTAILILAFCLQLSAKSVSQTVNITVSDMKLEDVLVLVKKQTGYSALYNVAALKDAAPVSVTAKDQPLEDFLQEIFKGQPLSFTIKKKTILIRKNRELKPVTFFHLGDAPPVSGNYSRRRWPAIKWR